MNPSRWRSSAAWLGRKADWVSGTAAFFAAFVIALSSGAVRDAGREALFVNAAVSVAVLAAVLGVLTVMVTFLGDDLTAVLEQTHGRTGGVMRPYVIVATVAAVSTVIGIGGAFVYPAALGNFQALLLALSVSALVASIAGTVQIIEITAFLATQRGDLIRGKLEAEALRKQRMRDSA